MHNAASSHNAFLSEQLDLTIVQSKESVPSLICFEVPQISNMPFSIQMTSMRLSFGVIMSSSCLASFRQITELMDMETVETVWLQASGRNHDLSGGGWGLLVEGDDASEVGEGLIWKEDAYGRTAERGRVVVGGGGTTVEESHGGG